MGGAHCHLVITQAHAHAHDDDSGGGGGDDDDGIGQVGGWHTSCARSGEWLQDAIIRLLAAEWRWKLMQ